MCSRYDLSEDIRHLQVALSGILGGMLHLARRDDMQIIPHAQMNAAPVPGTTATRTDATATAVAGTGTGTDTHADANADPYADAVESIAASYDDGLGTRRPTDTVNVIVPGNRLVQRRWGIVIPGLASPLINARAETLPRKATFRPLLNRRCLVPASLWHEWRKDGALRRRNEITLPDHRPFLFAGLENGHQIVIITCPAAPSIAHIHDRMPAILGPAHAPLWLDPARSFDTLRHVLAPAPDHVLAWHEDTGITLPPSDKQHSLF